MFENILPKIHIKKEWKIAFLSTFIIGLFAHIYKFVNYLPNHDGLKAFYDNQNIIGSGRWFLAVPAALSSNFDIPLVIGILAIIYISVSAVVIIELFKVSNPVVIVLIGGVMAAFPGVTDSFEFGYTSDAYMLGLLMSTFAVYLSKIGSDKIIPNVISVILLCLACATYQAFIPYALVLIICFFVYHLFENDFDNKTLIRYVVKEIIIAALAMSLYYIIWKILLKIENVEITDYLGINNAGIFFSTVLSGLKRSVGEISYFIFESNLSRENITFYCASNVIFILAFGLSLAVAFFKSKIYKSAFRTIFLIGSLFISYPCIVLWDLVSEETVLSLRTLFSVVAYIILAILLYERYFSIHIKNLFAVFIALIIFNYSLMSNITYLYMTRCYDQSLVVASEMMYDIHDYEDKYNIDTVAFIGVSIKFYPISNLTNINDAKTDDFHRKINVMIYDKDLLNCNYNAYFFLSNYCGLDLKYTNTNVAELLSQDEEIKKMPCWPSNDSITVRDNCLIIKLG